MEAFAISDQHAETIAKLFVEHNCSLQAWCTWPEELLSVQTFSQICVCEILDVKKINTSGYSD